jgi:hypothetical protein
MNQDEPNHHAEARRYLRLRLDNVREALTDADQDERLMQECLCAEARITVNLQLSAGGPGDGFEISCDAATGQPLRGCHYFTSWGFHKEVPLSPEELADVCAAYALEDARPLLDRGPLG